MKPAVRNRYRTNLRIVVYRLLLAYKVHHVLNGYRIWKHHGTEVRSGCTAVRACMWNGEKELETRKHNPWSFKSLRRGTPIHRCLKLILIHVTYPLSIIYEGRSPSKDGQRARGWLFKQVSQLDTYISWTSYRSVRRQLLLQSTKDAKYLSPWPHLWGGHVKTHQQ